MVCSTASLQINCGTSRARELPGGGSSSSFRPGNTLTECVACTAMRGVTTAPSMQTCAIATAAATRRETEISDDACVAHPGHLVIPLVMND
jgi:hypothetical protein